jgi:hypothetical protein
VWVAAEGSCFTTGLAGPPMMKDGSILTLVKTHMVHAILQFYFIFIN